MTLIDAAQLITNAFHLTAPTFQLPDSTNWPQLVHHADGHSLTPLLYDTWRQAGALAQLPPNIRQRMAQAYADNARRNQNIRRELLDVHQILTQAGVPHLVLKGWPLLEQLYTNPAHRVLYDHDFLVPAERAAAGQQALKAAGFRPLPGKDEWVEKHLPPLWRNNGYQWDGYLFDPHYPRPVELHLRLWEQGWRGLRVHSLPNPWADTRTCPVAGEPMQLLSLENTLIHLAMHFAGHLIEREARLNQLLDLARFVAQMDSGGLEKNEGNSGEKGASAHFAGPLDWDKILARTSQANVGRFVYASLWLAHNIFGSPLPPAPVWPRLAAATPPAFRTWLTEHGPADVLTSDYRRVAKGKDYQLTFLAADSLRERAGIVRFAALPPVGQLVKKYNVRYRWLGPFYYPRHLAERVAIYGRGVVESILTRN